MSESPVPTLEICLWSLLVKVKKLTEKGHPGVLGSDLGRDFSNSDIAKNSLSISWNVVVEVVMTLFAEYPSGITTAMICSTLTLHLNSKLINNRYSSVEEVLYSDDVQHPRPFEAVVTRIRKRPNCKRYYILF